MRHLSINSKVVLILGASLILIFGAVTIITSYQEGKSLSRLYSKNDAEINWLLQKQIAEVMINGDNDKLQQLAEEAVAKGLMQELTVINNEALVKRSSDLDQVNRVSKDALWRRILITGRDSVISFKQNGVPLLVSYKAFHNSEACSKCHDANTEKILGGIKSIVSELPIRQAVTSNYVRNGVITFFKAIILIGSVVLILRKLVFRPLRDVTANRTA